MRQSGLSFDDLRQGFRGVQRPLHASPPVCRNRDDSLDPIKPRGTANGLREPEPEHRAQSLAPAVFIEPNELAKPPTVFSDSDGPPEGQAPTPTSATTPIGHFKWRNPGRTERAGSQASFLFDDGFAARTQTLSRRSTLNRLSTQRAASRKHEVECPQGETSDHVPHLAFRCLSVGNCLRLLNSHPTVIMHGSKRFHQPWAGACLIEQSPSLGDMTR